MLTLFSILTAERFKAALIGVKARAFDDEMADAETYARSRAAAVVALGFLSFCLIAALVGRPPRLDPASVDWLPLVRLALLFILICATYVSFTWLTNDLARRLTTSWWDPAPAKFAAELEWVQVYELVAFDDRFDPLEAKPRPRRSLLPFGKLFVVSLAGWAIVFTLVDFLRDPRLPQVAPPPAGQAVGSSSLASIGNPAAYLALLVSLITIFFAYQHLRAKVRADSRQQWIIQARKLTGEVVALTDAYRDYYINRDRAAVEVWEKMNPLRLELELMLNPSEKDHRLLLYLIQRFASRQRTAGKQVQDAVMMRRSIARSEKPANPPLEEGRCEPQPGVGEPDLDRAWNRIIYATERGDLISYILRLSHVVLKREWERVKHTR